MEHESSGHRRGAQDASPLADGEWHTREQAGAKQHWVGHHHGQPAPEPTLVGVGVHCGRRGRAARRLPHRPQAGRQHQNRTQPDGGIYSPKIGRGNYNTSIAILMLVALENPKHRRTIDRATQYVTGIQKKADPSEDTGSGGWGYDPERKKKADMSNTNWALEAITAAKQAGVEVDPRVYERALVFLKRCQNDPEVNDQVYAAANPDGGAIYRPAESKAGKVIIRGRQGWLSDGSMTYARLKC